jgi:hypothetical protein
LCEEAKVSIPENWIFSLNHLNGNDTILDLKRHSIFFYNVFYYLSLENIV